MKASDYLAHFLAVNGVKQVFGLQGGAVVHLFDSIERLDNISAIYCHHEQSAALAAVANAKMTGNLGCVMVTTGPASTNAITGLLAAWQDSIPVIFISGQTRIEHTSYGKPVRQVGSQEFAILDLVQPITKYACMVEAAEQLPSILTEAVQAAISGRPGPVWIDFPVNLQWSDIKVSAPIPSVERSLGPIPHLGLDIADQLFKELRMARRPLIVAGNGIRSADCAAAFRSFIEKFNLPFVTSWTAADLLPSNHPLNAGILGVAGQRGANKAIYSSDLLFCLGCHLGLTQTSTLTDSYAPNARKIIIDIDSDQLSNLTVQFDYTVHANLAEFFNCVDQMALPSINGKSEWPMQIGEFRKMNLVDQVLDRPDLRGNKETVNSNYFNYRLTEAVPSSSSLVIDGGGTALYTGFQASNIKAEQRIICSSAISAMGTGLPEAIGVSFAKDRGEVYCIIGDGSLMLNLQELQTIYHHNLPIKIVVYNNNGYLAIKHTQEAFLEKRYFGTDSNHGVSIPPIKRIAECFSLPYLSVKGIDDMSKAIETIVSHSGSMLIEVLVSDSQPMLFQQGYRRNEDGSHTPADLSEMKPFL